MKEEKQKYYVRKSSLLDSESNGYPYTYHSILGEFDDKDLAMKFLKEYIATNNLELNLNSSSKRLSKSSYWDDELRKGWLTPLQNELREHYYISKFPSTNKFEANIKLEGFE